MKAFLIVLVILVILGGAAFYFGWVQILLPPEHYAVVFTKTGGYDQDVIPPGQFVWRWERLIPTNMTLHIFDLTPRSKEVSFRGSLPSADLYSSVLPDNPDFSVSGTVHLQFAVAPDSLPALVSEKKLSPEGLDDFYSARAEDISARVMDAVQEIRTDMLSGAELDRRQSYRDLVQIRDRSREQAIANQASEQVRAENSRDRQEANLELLKEYGKLLNEYPILLKALAVQKLSGEQLKNIPELDLDTILQ